MKGIPIMEIIGGTVKTVVAFFDMMYKQGWMLYFIAGVIIFTIYIFFFN